MLVDGDNNVLDAYKTSIQVLTEWVGQPPTHQSPSRNRMHGGLASFSDSASLPYLLPPTRPASEKR